MTRRLTAAGRACRDFPLAVLVVCGVLPLWFLPGPAAMRVGRLYGRIAFALWPYGRRVGMINLRRAYGSTMSYRQARQWTWDVFGHLGQSIAEGIQFARRVNYGSGEIDQVYEPEDQALEAAVLADPRPKIFVTGHLGSWEVATAVAGRRVGGKGGVIARRIDNPFLDAVVRRLRVGATAQWIDKRGAASNAHERLQRGESIALLLDESAGPRGVFVEFFSRPASTAKLAALLALKLDLPIVVGAAVRRPGRGKLWFRLALIEPSHFAGDGTDAVRNLTQHVVARYEQWVRDAPRQWRWIHWRWKHRPDGSEETYTRRNLIDAFRDERAGTSESAERSQDERSHEPQRSESF